MLVQTSHDVWVLPLLAPGPPAEGSVLHVTFPDLSRRHNAPLPQARQGGGRAAGPAASLALSVSQLLPLGKHAVLAAAALAELRVPEPERGASLQAPTLGWALDTPSLLVPSTRLTLPEVLQPLGSQRSQLLRR